MTLLGKIHYLLFGNGLSLWYVVRPFRDSRERRAIIRHSMTRGQSKNTQRKPTHHQDTPCATNTVCCLFEGASDAGGLADRLRGVVAVYEECKRVGLPFRIYFKHPFDLELFLRPAGYDWRIDSRDICRDSDVVDVLVMRPLSDSEYTMGKQRRWLRDTFDGLAKRPFVQAHLYTNASTSYRGGYSRLFAELFRPTERLQKALDETQKLIGGRYISVSMRFLALLGDFEDTVYAGAVLTDVERGILVDSCVAKIEELHRCYPGHRILVNSDSQTMLRAVENIPYTYTISGNISHLDRCRHCADEYEQFEKTFLDFFTIAQADEVFLIKQHPKMRESGFPYAAAMIGGKPFKIV